MIRAFAAIALPAEQREKLALAAQLLPLPRRVSAANLHLTLSFFGDLPEPVLAEVHYAFEAIRAPGFRLTLRGLGHFGGERPRAAYAGLQPEPALDRLQAKVDQAARRAGAAPEARRFVPHVTLGRFRPGEVDLPLLERALIEGAGLSLPAFAVGHFALYRSHLGRGEPWYEELARYALG